MNGDGGSVRQRALDLLARREHSLQELQEKLETRGFDRDAVTATLADLREEGLQSDHRYTESYVHARLARGYGPLHISWELRGKGISDTLISEYLDHADLDWLRLAAEARRRKFGAAVPDGLREQARQARFLEHRGFPGGLIRRIFRTDET